MLNTKEHYELMAQFEKEFKGAGRMDKETKGDWARGIIYEDGIMNNLFKVYRSGYAYGKCVERLEA
jgi:hypothetical protein